MPTFLNPLFAAAAAAIAIPALLVLYFLKLRRKEHTVPTTLLWKKAVQDLQVNAPFQRLRRNLLLFLQLLLLILMLLALSRPVVSYTPGPGQATVILIDRSASMSATDVDGKTRLDIAKTRASDLVGGLSKNGRAMVIAFDDSAETLQPFTSDTLALRRAIDSIRPTDRPSRLKTAYLLAEAQTNFNPEQLRENFRPDIRVFSDGRVLDGADLSVRGEVTLEKIGSDTAENVAVVALSAKRNYERPTEVQVFARLANFGPNPTAADVALTIDGRVARSGVAGTFLYPDRWDDRTRDEFAAQGGERHRDSVEFKAELTDAALLQVQVRGVPGDMLPADNIAQIVVPPPKPLAVLLVSNGNNPFLEHLVMRSMGLNNPAQMTLADFEAKQPDSFDVIVFDAVRPAAFPPAGNYIWCGMVPPGLTLKAQTVDGAMMAEPGVTGVLDWKRDHPMLRDLSLINLYASDPIIVEPAPESEVLITGLRHPLLVLHREGRSTHLVMTFDPLHSTWPIQVTWPLFIHNALQFLALGSELDVKQSYPTGQTVRIPRVNLQRAAEGAPLSAVTLTGPSGSVRLPIPEAGDLALPPLTQAGVYTLEPPVPQFDRLAVNLLDESESNLIPADGAPGGIGEVIEAATSAARLELWWWLIAAAALPMLMIEWWVYTRRVHL